MISHVVFDFDGTIANSGPALIALYNRIAERRRFKPIREEDLTRLLDLPFTERCRELDIPWHKLPLLVVEVVRRYKEIAPSVKPFEGMIALLQALHTRGVRVGIISTNSRENIERFLREHGAEALVHSVTCSNDVFGKDKLIHRYLKTFGVSPEEVLYVGDEQRDVVASKKARLRIISVSWGYDSLARISAAGPDFIVDAPTGILERVAQLNGWVGVVSFP
ncbi:HAD hydrolase-like protein [Myxococcaceae bacterium GXIMD 01537]